MMSGFKVEDIGKRINKGFRLHPVRFFFRIYLWTAGIYTMLSLFSMFIPVLTPESTTWKGLVTLGSICLIGTVAGVVQSAETARIRFKIKLISTTLHISFGDIFCAEGAKVIAVNEYFDSEVPNKVAQKSLHGQLIQNRFKGKSQEFEQAVDQALMKMSPEGESSRRKRAKRYSVGTTAVVEVNDAVDKEQFFLPVLTKTDEETNKASCDLRLFTVAMSQLWETLRNQVQGEPVNLPLMGSGQAQVDLPPQQLLQTIIMTLVEASKSSGRVTDEVHIILPPSCEKEIDLDVIKRNWS